MKVLIILVVLLAGTAGYLWFVDPKLGRELLGDTPIAPPSTVTTAYKWRDAQGNWQLTDEPPPEGTPYETIQADPGANVLPSLQRGKD